MESNSEKTLVYLLFATPGAGGAAVAQDLLEGLDGLYDGDLPPMVLAQGDDLRELEQVKADGRPFRLVEYRIREGRIEADDSHNAGGAPVVILAPPLVQPPDVMEALREFLRSGESDSLLLGRILTIVDCGRLSTTPEMRPWVLCCVHFSDAVLLNRREDVPNRWIRDFEAYFQKECYPCRFFLVKKDRVGNPSEVMQPEARRLSLIFDDLSEMQHEAEFFDEDMEDDEGDGEASGRGEDSYLVRLESGARARPIPSIAPLFEQSSKA